MHIPAEIIGFAQPLCFPRNEGVIGHSPVQEILEAIHGLTGANSGGLKPLATIAQSWNRLSGLSGVNLPSPLPGSGTSAHAAKPSGAQLSPRVSAGRT